MADYYSHFSVAVHATTEQAEFIIEAVSQYRDSAEAFDSGERFTPANEITVELLKLRPLEDYYDPGFELGWVPGEIDQGLWIHDECGSPDLDFLAKALQLWLAHFKMTEPIGFQWSNNCSKPRLDAYGGGAVLITAESIDWLSTQDWLENQLKKVAAEQTGKSKKSGRQLLLEVVETVVENWPEFKTDEPINGGDLVDFIGGWLLEATIAIATAEAEDARQLSRAEDPALNGSD